MGLLEQLNLRPSKRADAKKLLAGFVADVKSLIAEQHPAGDKLRKIAVAAGADAKAGLWVEVKKKVEAGKKALEQATKPVKEAKKVANADSGSDTPTDSAVDPGADAKFEPDGGKAPHRPLGARTVRLRLQVPSGYEGLRESVEARFARELMSRTLVRQPDGSRSPIHRERELVERSNLRALYSMMRPGEQVELTVRMIPGAGGNRYERLVFALPADYVAGGDVEFDVSGRVGAGGIAPPNYVPPHPPANRDEAWRLAQRVLEEQLGGTPVGGGPQLMWTPTPTGISRMMPAVPGPMGFGPGGDAVPRQAGQTNPRWAVMPAPLNDTARVLGQMLQRRFNMDRIGGAADLDPAAVRSVVNDFIAEARRAKAARNDRLARLGAAAAISGGELMFAEDLRRYTAAETRLFEGDPTCLWRYVN